MTSMTETQLKRQAFPWFDLLLIALIVVGLFFRFNWVNWNQDADLHPDEYGLTATLTALRIPDSWGEYFNTRISPISPYQKYDENGQAIQNGPDNRMRWGQWPIFLVRLVAEQTDLTGYTEMRLLGRQLSAFADVLSLMLLFLIGERLYSRRVGLLATALGALAVMQIQQSHFLTTDNFAVLFNMLALYAVVEVAHPEGKASGKGWGWYALFGVALGMAVASKINLAPLAGMLALAALLRVSREVDLRSDFWRGMRRIVLPLALAAALSLVTFRLTQPMSFRAATGDTTVLTLTPNSDWLESMKVAANEFTRHQCRASRRAVDRTHPPGVPVGQYGGVGHGAAVGVGGLGRPDRGGSAGVPAEARLAGARCAAGVGGRLLPVHGHAPRDVDALLSADVPIHDAVRGLGAGAAVAAAAAPG